LITRRQFLPQEVDELLVLVEDELELLDFRISAEGLEVALDNEPEDLGKDRAIQPGGSAVGFEEQLCNARLACKRDFLGF